jgi:hypothetical protein
LTWSAEASVAKYEYLVRSIKTMGPEEKVNASIQKDLGTMAASGWRLVAATHATDTTGRSDWLRVIWEREVA